MKHRTLIGRAGVRCADGRRARPKVVKIVQSYVGIVDKMVWRKF